MKQFEWKTGELDKIGFYLTTRETKLGGNVHRYVSNIEEIEPFKE